MDNFYNDLYNKINKYKNQNCNRIVALKLANWCLKSALALPILTKKAGKRTLKVAMKLNGGVGDILAQSTYLMSLIKYLNQENIEFDLFACRDRSLLDSLFYKANYVKNRYTWKESEKITKQYDLILTINRFVSISQINWQMLDMNSPKLFEYCKKIEEFSQENQFLFNHPPFCDYTSMNLALANNKNRLTHADILNILNMPDEPDYFMDLNPEKFAVFKHWGLENSQYITLQRGLNHNDNKQDATRNWPLSHYDELVTLIRQHYPKIKIIQLGYSEQNCKKIAGVDLDLRGKTTFDELKVLLKHGLLHIDSEGGYAHIRHFLGGKSVILFGPTPLPYYGYKDNINIKSNICQTPCEWLTSTWLDKCCRGFDTAPCMVAIQPTSVFEEIKKYILMLPNFVFDVLFEKKNTFDYLPSDSEKIALFNIKPTELLFDQSKNLTIFSTKIDKDAKVVFSGQYNIPAKDSSYNIIYASLDPNEPYPGFVLQELLRILACNGQLFLRIDKIVTKTELFPLKLILPEISDIGIIKIVKRHTLD